MSHFRDQCDELHAIINRRLIYLVSRNRIRIQARFSDGHTEVSAKSAAQCRHRNAIFVCIFESVSVKRTHYNQAFRL